ncbi:Glycosyl transferase, group 1 [Rhodospirillum rubrum ATCC 11170]|uniref:Glycosyl transferase, group 1 n=4 Tax=Rhodospirillum rubrum TaxID=1085 RepID=Q2RRF2_RHORT|nr:Glycosyl transferase, group 1 [Rhodospirillum rubrum ATCC 11170]
MATMMMNDMAARGLRVGLLTWDPEDATAHYPMDPAITWMKLAMGEASQRAGWGLRLRRQRAIRRLARGFRPDVVIGFQAGAFIALRTALVGLGIPMIAAERNAPDLYDFLRQGVRARRMTELALATASRITVQLPSYRPRYPAFLRRRIVDIPNPVPALAEPPYPNEAADPPRLILNMGRLSYQKNQAFLLRAFARVAPTHPEWTLAFVGDGDAGATLKALCHELDLDDRVLFPGATRDVGAWYARSAFLAFPSLWEGFPNALVEAFAHGLPAVGLRTTSGVNELIVEGETGLLSAPDEGAFAEALARMIRDDEARREMGRKAARSILAYDPKAIFDRWEALFRAVAKRRSAP